MNPLLHRKTSVDALLTELARPNVGTAEDRTPGDWENPFAQKRNKPDQVPVKSDPKTSSVDLQTDQVDGHDRILPPREKAIRSEQTTKDLKKEMKKDQDGYKSASEDEWDDQEAINDQWEPVGHPEPEPGSPWEPIRLTSAKNTFDFGQDRTGRVARKVAANPVLRQYVKTANVKVDTDTLILNIPRGKVALQQISPHDITKMEQELSKVLMVRAKFANVVLSSGFDGVSLEFMMV